MKSICSGTGLSGGAAIGAVLVSTAFSHNISQASREFGTPIPQKGPRFPPVLAMAA